MFVISYSHLFGQDSARRVALLELISISAFHFTLAQYCKEEMETNLTAAELCMGPNCNW